MGQTKPLHNNQKRMTAFAYFRDLGGADLYNQLINSFRIYLCKFNILGWCEPEDVMSESLVRYVEALKSGKIIYNIEAWLRSTGFNVVREFSRQRKDGKARVTFVDTRVLDSFACAQSNNVRDLVMEEEYSTLYKAMQKLDTKTQELLYMRYFEKLSWQEIAQRLASQGEVVLPDTLRQRGKRALKALTKQYQEILGL